MPTPKPALATEREEARRWQRHEVSIPVSVTIFPNGERSTCRGQGCDISRGGMRLFVTRELDPGTSLILEFAIPYHAIQFTMSGIIRNRSGFTHGVEFINATPHQQQMIDRTCKIFDLLR